MSGGKPLTPFNVITDLPHYNGLTCCRGMRFKDQTTSVCVDPGEEEWDPSRSYVGHFSGKIRSETFFFSIVSCVQYIMRHDIRTWCCDMYFPDEFRRLFLGGKRTLFYDYWQTVKCIKRCTQEKNGKARKKMRRLLPRGCSEPWTKLELELLQYTHTDAFAGFFLLLSTHWTTNDFFCGSIRRFTYIADTTDSEFTPVRVL